MSGDSQCESSLYGAIFKTTNGRASILVVSHCTVFTIKTSSHVMRTGNRGNLRYCNVIKPMVIGAHFKNIAHSYPELFVVSWNKYFFETRCVSRNIRCQKQSYPEVPLYMEVSTSVVGPHKMLWRAACGSRAIVCPPLVYGMLGK